MTRTGVSFQRVGNTFTYTLWFNSSQTANSTQNVDEIYGLNLMSFVRGLDEAIGACSINRRGLVRAGASRLGGEKNGIGKEEWDQSKTPTVSQF